MQPLPLALTRLLALALLDGAEQRPPDLTGLPRLRFPPVPPPPLGGAVSAELGVQHWDDLLAGLPVPSGATLLEFGCGASRTRTRVSRLGYRWFGLDIPDSQESQARVHRDSVVVYDGGTVPFADASFDVVLSVQVFEHVTDPHLTFAEVARILKPGGHLLGSTSHLEPFHSASTFCYTPAVFAQLLERNGLQPQVVSAGIDGMTLMTRRLLRQFGAVDEARSLDPFFSADSPLNLLIEQCGRAQGVDERQINALALELAGHFHFLAEKRSS